MFINLNISNKSFFFKETFGQNTPEILSSENATTNPIEAKEINLNNTPSVQNKVIVQSTPPYKEIQTFEVPNVGKGKMYELKNGHKVLILPKQGPTNIATFFKVGSLNEPKRIQGISHLLEHLVAPVEFDKLGTISNASTGGEETSYYTEFSSENDEDLEKIIKIQSKVFNVKDLAQEDIERERKVITSEASERRGFYFDEVSQKVTFENIFGKGDYDLYAGGDYASIQNITKQDLLEHYEKFYSPDNSVTAIVGDIDPETTIKIVSKYFNTPPRAKGVWESDSYMDFSHYIQKAQRVDLKEPREDKKFLLTLDFVGPPNTIEARAKARILSDIFSKKTFSELDEKTDGYADFNYSYIDSRATSPLLLKFTTFYKDKSQLKDIYKTFFDASQNGIKDEDLEKAKNNLKRSFFEEQYSGYLAGYFAEEVLKGKSPNVRIDNLAVVDSITKEEVEDFAKKYLDLNKASVVVYHPDKKPEAVSFEKNNQIDMSHIKEYELDNNLAVIIDNTPGTSKTTIAVELSANKKPSQKSGTSLILSYMLLELSHKPKYESEGLAINFDSSDMGSLMATISCDNDQDVLGLKQAKEIFLTTKLDEKTFQKAKKKTQQILNIIAKSGSLIKEDELFDSTKWKQIQDNMDKITLQDVIDFRNEILSDSEARAIITMPFKERESSKNNILRELSQGFPPLSKFKNIEPEKPKSLDKSYVLLEKCKQISNQTTVKQSFKIFYSENAKDNVSKDLLSTLLRSRMEKDLREKQGIVYSPYTKFDNVRLSLIAETETGQHPENIRKIVESFERSTADLINNAVSKEELDAAKMRARNNIWRNIEISSDKNIILCRSANTPYGAGYINEQLNALKEITPENIQKTAELMFEAPSVTSVYASKEAIEVNKEYLKTKGEIIVIENI